MRALDCHFGTGALIANMFKCSTMKNAIVLLAILFVPSSLFAWGSAGHEVIAAEAWRQLSPESKAEVIEVLKHHPDYQKWQSAYHTNASFNVYAFIFMKSSTWPDEIRRRGNKYDHPNWHFIDYPLRPPDFKFEPDNKPNDNVLYGVSECEKTLSDTNADPELRAAMLSFLVHLVGDMHQPLHCESLFTAEYPTGDKGGNDFYVKPGQRAVRLHGIWDGLLGSSANTRTHWNYAIELENRFPRGSLPELTKDTTPKEWSLESRELAIDKGYLKGELQGSTNAANAPSLPPDYTKNAKAAAERQGALAGYRLADEIQKYLKVSSPVPLLPVSALTAGPTSAPKKITAIEATNYYEQDVVVKAKVVQVSTRPSVNFLNLDAAFPDSPLTAVIFDSNVGDFGDLKKFEGKDVEIAGTVTKYRGKPEIVLESSNQLKVLSGK
jgi:hypothetical protein